MSYPREEWVEEEGRQRRQQKGNSCEECGERGGRQRFDHGTDVGVLCDQCWWEKQDVL